MHIKGQFVSTPVLEAYIYNAYGEGWNQSDCINKPQGR